MKRSLMWIALWLVGGFLQYKSAVAESQVAYDAGDLSAFAWMGFLPFLVPMFLIQPGMVVGAVAVCVELILWWRK